MQIQSIVRAQRNFFETGVTLPVSFRIKTLKKIKKTVLEFEPEIKDALASDLGKSRSESYMTEIAMTLSELNWMIRHVRRLSRKKRVHTPLAQFPSSTFRLAEPYGSVLVMSPWNYPFMLAMGPTIDALGAGNTVVIKPSAYAPETAKVLQRIFETCLPKELVCVVTGGRFVNKSLLENRFDYIFFTGSSTVGRLVLSKASEFLTPVSLELGGKSPCIVDKSADLPVAARRIVFGKYLNAGQTCVAPDYVMVHKDVKEKFLEHVKKEIKIQFGDNPLENRDYGRIVNEKHFSRLMKMLKNVPCVIGGKGNEKILKIEPTVIDNVETDFLCMQEEIFGPIMPILTFSSLEEVKQVINLHPTPLALYIFTFDKNVRKTFLNQVRFGGGCVNDTIIHLATSELGFGGVGTSGMGAYHGQSGFDTFTHYKTIVHKKTWLDLPIRYQPYNQIKDKIIRLFIR